MFSAHRRHSTKRPSDASTASTDAVRLVNESQPSKVGGIFSYFARARRRLVKTSWETDTLLPTTYPSTNAGLAPHKRSSMAGLTCNSFLMGGHYYPGKDKKRRHLRRRTLWYKVFCSSTWRKFSSFLLMAYVLVWHILLPLGDWLIQLGLTMSIAGHHPNRFAASNWLLYDSTLKIPDLSQEQKISFGLLAARARLQHSSPERHTQRLELLEGIVPGWYHRNDAPKKQDEKIVGLDSPGGKQQEPAKASQTNATPEKGATKSENNVAPDVKKVINPKQEIFDQAKILVNDKDAAKTSQSRMLIAGGDNLTVRTIHTPLDEASLHSKCQAIDKDEYSTTLVTQSSLSRLWILNETCTRWTDPIIAVIFVPHGQEKNDPVLASLACPNLQIIQYMASVEESDPINYPVNRLRNVGLDAVQTSHVMVVDVDFLPSLGLAEKIRQSLILRHQHHQDGEDEQALVVPAFERLPPSPCGTDRECAAYLQTNKSFIPSSFDDLQKCVNAKECTVFQSNNNWEGHSTTRSDQWLQRKWFENEEEMNTFKTIRCFHTARYEPYLVLRWCPSSNLDSKGPVAPYYDERFHGYGKNKIEVVSHLRKKGYQFAILPEGFIVHHPHPESKIKEAWNDRNGSDLHSSMDKLYTDFLGELDTMYRDAHERSVKLCKRKPPQ